MNGPDRSSSEGFVCPNCQTLNNPNAEICVSCGVRFEVYEQVKQELTGKISDRQNEKLRTIQDETQQKLQEEQKKTTKEFGKKLIVLLIIGIALIPVIWGTLKLIQHEKIVRQQFIESNYQSGLDCLSSKDYQCAEEYFQIVFNRDKGFQDTLDLLIKSKIGIAEELFNEKQVTRAIEKLNTALSLDAQNTQLLSLINDYHKFLGNEYKEQETWQKALDEYSLALASMPDDFETRHEINEIYTLWIKDEKSKGNLLKAWQLKIQKDKFNDE